jgi:hypothetical protein
MQPAKTPAVHHNASTAMADNDATRLKVACQNAYDPNPDLCSHAVWSVIRAYIDTGAEHRQANKRLDWSGVTAMQPQWPECRHFGQDRLVRERRQAQ